jgi:hypothetical protein
VTKFILEASITAIPELDKDRTKKENYKLISLIGIHAKILNKYLQTNSTTHQNDYGTMNKLISSTVCNSSSMHINH